ncbi:heterokaryon incompatibility protein-domain-containing protein [Corynascus novoguineensis]|uniref:Heterokaryon incompatibility protein-domain-containing protein n=1 Tax=Corynascus novoguineensis TaxID=1126955 RepID=A0AAN7CK79_9PEZI|nr:heterokaryon incompatibility protein-domain-containing protein [Corynascus novoguineensis]
MASAPAQSYPYRPLNSSTHEIRLLTLTPESPDDNPNNSSNQTYSLSLTHAALAPRSSPGSTPPSFSALSYVWGAPVPSSSTSTDLPTVIIDGHRVPVTASLRSALARLARERCRGDRALVLWVDALCINQVDAVEKSWQVGLMSRLYRLAEEVLVWLGPDDGEEEKDGGSFGAGLRAVRELGALFRDQVTGGPSSFSAVSAPPSPTRWERVEGFVKTVLQFSITADSGPGTAKAQQGRLGFDFEAIWRLFRERPWWRRLWIIQEVVLARKATLFVGADPAAGATCADWEDVGECIRLFEWMVLYPSTAPEHRRLYALLDDIYPNVSHLLLAWNGYKRSVEESKEKFTGTIHDQSDLGMPLLDALLWTSFGTGPDGAIQATDVRDRIYGLLGMVRKQDRCRIPVDYSADMTIGKLLFLVARLLLNDHGPDILSFCQRTPGSTMKQGLSSWAPDWTDPGVKPTIGGVHFGEKDAELYENASGGASWRDWAPKCKIEAVSYENPLVSLPTVLVGLVERVGQEFKAAPNSPNYLNDCRSWLSEMDEMAKSRLGPGTGTEKETWRVPIANFGLAKRADDEDPSRFIHGFNVLTGKVVPPSDLKNNTAVKRAWMMSESWEYRRVWKGYNRKAFIDDAGRLGLGPEGVVAGDRVAIFAGGHVPFVLRKQPGTNAYHVLGPAYVLGLMSGEGVTEGSPFDWVELT